MTESIEQPPTSPALACGTTPQNAAKALVGFTWPGMQITVTATHMSGSGGFRVFGRICGPMIRFDIKIDGVAVPGGFVVTGWE
jgi:hypothetical protein